MYHVERLVNSKEFSMENIQTKFNIPSGDERFDFLENVKAAGINLIQVDVNDIMKTTTSSSPVVYSCWGNIDGFLRQFPKWEKYLVS